MTGRILLAMGAAAQASGLAARLSDAFLDVVEAPDGKAALAAARREEPSLVLADAAASGLPGLALCRTLKADSRLAHVPVVLIAGREARGQRLAGLEAGADDFLSPPVSDDALLARIRSLLRMKAMVDELRRREETARELGLPADRGNHWVRAAEGPPARLLLAGGGAASARRLAAQVAATLGAEVEQAPDGRAALEAAASREWDLLLVIPEGPGEAQSRALRLVSAMRARAASRDAGLVVVTHDAETSAAALDLGASDAVSAPPDLAELTARLRCQLRRKRYSDRLREAVQDGLMMAATDPLTGLYNRRYAERHLGRMLAQCARNRSPMSLMLLDLDRFKTINDARGHPAGDSVLRGFAARLRETVRGADLVARLGGEEFCVAMAGAGADQARRAAERVRCAVAAAPFTAPEGPPIPVTVSIGVAVAAPDDADPAPEDLDAWRAQAEPLTRDSAPCPRTSTAALGLAEPAAAPFRRPRPSGCPSALIAAADAALYRSKAEGRDRITLAPPTR